MFIIEDYRRDLHDRLLLSKHRPLFKRLNAVTFGVQEDDSGPYLCNTHVGLPKSGGTILQSCMNQIRKC